jgi:glutaredoxin
MSRKETTPGILQNKGIIAGIIAIVVIIAGIAIVFATSTSGGGTAAPPEECGRSVIAYVNKNLAQDNATATFVSTSERNGMYYIVADYKGQNVSFYAAKDCKRMFTSSYSLDTAANPMPTLINPVVTTPVGRTATSRTPVPEPVKSARPSVELYVMSFCPFGVQAENALGPVVTLLGSKADFTIRYIATTNGTNLAGVKSLHGPAEAKEDSRQLCIAKNYPEKIWPYLTDFNAQCYPVYRNSSQLEVCQKNVTAVREIDNAKIETCATGSEGMALLSADEKITKSLKVTGSPTLFMNGQKYAGQRTADAYRQALCARFETPPAECSTNLSTQAAASTGSCE